MEKKSSTYVMVQMKRKWLVIGYVTVAIPAANWEQQKVNSGQIVYGPTSYADALREYVKLAN